MEQRGQADMTRAAIVMVVAFTEEDMTGIERVGRRCEVCHSGRQWRRFEVVHPAERVPVVLCPSCHVRYGEDPPVGRVAGKPDPVAPAPKSAASASRSRPKPAQAKPNGAPPPAEPGPDRLLTAIRKLSGEVSVATAARAAGLNSDKTLARLQELEARGEVQRVGNRWSAEAPPSELASAMDRLQARTSNLRIVRDRARVS